MDIWENGRKGLTEALNGVYDRIGADLATQLNRENNAYIPREKFKELQQKAAKVDELKDEVSSLIRQKQDLEAWLTYEKAKTAEIKRVAQENARLAEELEAHKSTSLRIEEGLTNENKCLTAKLEHALSRSREGRTPGSSIFSSTPMPNATDVSSSVPRIDGNGVPVVAKDAYETLVKKFNKLYENHKELSSARETIEKALIAKKQELKKSRDNYDNNFDILEKKLKRRDATIEQQEKETQRLKALIQNVNGEGHMSQVSEIGQKSKAEREAQNLEEISIALKSASTGPIQYAGKYLGFDDIVRTLSPTLNEILKASRSIRVPTSSPLGRLRNFSHAPLESDDDAEEHMSRASSQSQDNRADFDLPMLLPGGDANGSEYRVAQTESETLKPYHTSTTSGLTPYKSSDELKAPEIKVEPSTDASPSPDTPIVISSRTLRKTHSRKANIEPNRDAKVKHETISSSPIGLAGFYALDESIDLDDIGDKQVTPRKGRPFLQQVIASVARNDNQSQHILLGNLSNSRVSQQTPSCRTGFKRKSSVLRPRTPNTTFLPRTSAEGTQKRRRVASGQAISDVIEDGQVILPMEETSTRKNPPPTPEQAQLLGNLLANASPSKRVLIPARSTFVQTKSKPTGGGLAVSSRAYEVPQDDTPTNATFDFTVAKRFTRSMEPAEPTRPTSKVSERTSKDTLGASFNGTLKSCVESPRPISKGTSISPAYESKTTSRHSPETGLGSSGHCKPSLNTPAQDQQPPPTDSLRGFLELQRASSKFTRSKPKAPDSAHQAAQFRSRDSRGTPSASGVQPLRTRPLSELALQDFKVNPRSNQGYGYAFREVVRKQADRRCLPGCTKPECCGNQFRVLAEATRNPNKIPTASQEEADEKLLNEFLGDNSYKLRYMTEAERHETLMQALTRDMANKVGKHRHAYERRQSPPGYWRSDFANTQEQEEDRAKAEQVQREELAHRYEEAMRGGAYIFRDE